MITLDEEDEPNSFDKSKSKAAKKPKLTPQQALNQLVLAGTASTAPPPPVPPTPAAPIQLIPINSVNTPVPTTLDQSQPLKSTTTNLLKNMLQQTLPGARPQTISRILSTNVGLIIPLPHNHKSTSTPPQQQSAASAQPTAASSAFTFNSSARITPVQSSLNRSSTIRAANYNDAIELAGTSSPTAAPSPTSNYSALSRAIKSSSSASVVVGEMVRQKKYKLVINKAGQTAANESNNSNNNYTTRSSDKTAENESERKLLIDKSRAELIEKAVAKLLNGAETTAQDQQVVDLTDESDEKENMSSKELEKSTDNAKSATLSNNRETVVGEDDQRFEIVDNMSDPFDMSSDTLEELSKAPKAITAATERISNRIKQSIDTESAKLKESNEKSKSLLGYVL